MYGSVIAVVWDYRFMTVFLDDERLNGPHAARLSARPQRVALPISANDPKNFEDIVKLECQI